MGTFLGGVILLAAIAAGLFGGVIMANAQSAVHEIEALICFLITVCGLGLTGVISALSRLSSIDTELRALHKLTAEERTPMTGGATVPPQPMR